MEQTTTTTTTTTMVWEVGGSIGVAERNRLLVWLLACFLFLTLLMVWPQKKERGGIDELFGIIYYSEDAYKLL
jgi:hypothetical protein